MRIPPVAYRLWERISPPPEKMPALSRYRHDFWNRYCTPSGRMLLGVTALISVASAISIEIPLYRFGIPLFLLLLINAIIGTIYRPHVEIVRNLPERCAAGAELTVRATLTNKGHWTLFDLAAHEHHAHSLIECDEDHTYVGALAPGASTALTYRLTPTRRGVYDFEGPSVMTAFPFGLYNRGVTIKQPHRMIVYPRFAPLSGIALPVGRKHNPGGLQLVSNVGDSEEFLGNREYRPGDRLRDVHHAAWARRGYPIVREFQQEFLCRIALIVDTEADPFTPEARDALEAALSLSAAVADVLSRQEYVIDIFAAGPDLYHFQAGRSLAYLDNILDILACIEASEAPPFVTLGPAIMGEIGQISTGVMVLLDWNEERDQFCRRLRESGVALKIIIVRSTPPTHDPRAFDGRIGAVHVLTPGQARTRTEAL